MGKAWWVMFGIFWSPIVGIGVAATASQSYSSSPLLWVLLGAFALFGACCLYFWREALRDAQKPRKVLDEERRFLEIRAASLAKRISEADEMLNSLERGMSAKATGIDAAINTFRVIKLQPADAQPRLAPAAGRTLDQINALAKEIGTMIGDSRRALHGIVAEMGKDLAKQDAKEGEHDTIRRETQGT